jgi:glycosyltransferase involved in cell wall biosynthesis
VPASPDRAPIAIVTPRYAPAIGGVERHVERLATGLAARGLPVEVLTTDAGSQLPRTELMAGVLVRRFPTLRGDETYFLAPRLLRWLWGNAGRYALVHAHNYQTLVPLSARLGARHGGVPLVLTPHYHAAGHTRFRAALHVPYRPVGRGVVRAADAVIAMSVAEAGWIERDFGVTASVIPPGVDLPTQEAPTQEEPAARPARRRRAPRSGAADGAATGAADGAATGAVTILTGGRLARYKQVDHVIGALPHLPATHSLEILGEGPEVERLRAEAVRLGVDGRVRMLGHVSAEELESRFRAADVFVTMSREESFGLTVLEAAAAGAPVVASDIPAHREVSGYAGAGRIALVDVDATGIDLAVAIERQRGAGRSTDRSGWNLPTWDGMVDGVLRTYEVVLGAPLTDGAGQPPAV